MSGTLTGAAARIAITQTQSDVRVSIVHGAPNAPFDLPVFPLSVAPSDQWELRIVNGVLQWVPILPPEVFSFTDSQFLVF